MRFERPMRMGGYGVRNRLLWRMDFIVDSNGKSIGDRLWLSLLIRQNEVSEMDAAKYYTPCAYTKDHVHLWTITGRPLSGNTWYVCEACGLRVFRG